MHEHLLIGSAYTSSKPVVPSSVTIQQSRKPLEAVEQAQVARAHPRSATQPTQKLSDYDLPPEHASEPVVLVKCTICSRKFREDRINKHTDACKKAHKKRKVMEKVVIPDELLKDYMEVKKNAPSPPKSQPKSSVPKWKILSEQLRAGIKAPANANGPPPPPTHDTRKQCPYCDRKFSDDAFDRHYNFCKNSNMKIGQLKKGGGTSAGRKAPPVSRLNATNRRR